LQDSPLYVLLIHLYPITPELSNYPLGGSLIAYGLYIPYESPEPYVNLVALPYNGIPNVNLDNGTPISSNQVKALSIFKF